MILFGEASLRHALTQDVAHVHHERNHQGKGKVLRFPPIRRDTGRAGPLQGRERLGGLWKYYECEAACIFWPHGYSLRLVEASCKGGSIPSQLYGKHLRLFPRSFRHVCRKS
jgi:hypothetical protein